MGSPTTHTLTPTSRTCPTNVIANVGREAAAGVGHQEGQAEAWARKLALLCILVAIVLVIVEVIQSGYTRKLNAERRTASRH